MFLYIVRQIPRLFVTFNKKLQPFLMITGQRHVASEDVMVSQRDETVVRLRVFIAVELVRLKPGADCEVLNSV